MSQPSIADLAAGLVAANRDPGMLVKAEDYAGISLPDSMEIQGMVMRALGENAAACKVALQPSGVAISAPIFGSLLVADGGRLPYPTRGLIGLEVEIAVRLKADLTPEAAQTPEGVAATIEEYLLGVEVIGTRLDDRTKAGTFGPLADNSVSAGYVYSSVPWTGGLEIDGLPVVIETNGTQFYDKPAKHGFGGVLNVLGAYGKAPIDHFGGLKAGMIVTTGSLCGIVPISGPGTYRASLGEQSISVILG